jgi:hypothetical protein
MLRCSKAVFIAFVLSVGTCMCAQETVSAPLAGAIVSDWKGGVQVQLPGTQSASPTRGEVLPDESVIDTRDGRLLLTLRADESQVLVQPKTRIVLHQPSSSSWNSLEVLLGRIRAFIRKQTGGARPFQLGTPSAVIAVRGTRFDVAVDKKGDTEVIVFEGIVEVTGLAVPPKSVIVMPGYSTRVRVGRAPDKPALAQPFQPDMNSPDAQQQNPVSRSAPSGTPRGGESSSSSEHEGPDH